jgi:predicted amidophosphoribosyltransferase
MTPSKKSPSATPFCKVCFKAFTAPSWRTLLAKKFPFAGLFPGDESPNAVLEGRGHRGVFSLFITSKIRDLLYQFKGCADIELAPIFLAYQAPILRFLYRGYTLVPAPSFEERTKPGDSTMSN